MLERDSLRVPGFVCSWCGTFNQPQTVQTYGYDPDLTCPICAGVHRAVQLISMDGQGRYSIRIIAAQPPPYKERP